jgi:hypothetical protein
MDVAWDNRGNGDRLSLWIVIGLCISGYHALNTMGKAPAAAVIDLEAADPDD